MEGVGLDGVLQHLLEVQLGGEGPAVVDDGLAAGAVPAVFFSPDGLSLSCTAPGPEGGQSGFLFRGEETLRQGINSFRKKEEKG